MKGNLAMRFSRWIAIFSLTLLASGCASFQKPYPGMPESELVNIRGEPNAEYQDGDIRTLEWTAPATGQYTYMARIAPDGRMISDEQVLTVEKFHSLKPGISTKYDVLRTVGHPNRMESEYLPLADSDVWSYRYKESGVWDSMMSIHFDRKGVVKRLENGIDPLYVRDN